MTTGGVAVHPSPRQSAASEPIQAPAEVNDLRGRIGPFVVFLVLIGASVPWRPDSFFQGEFDFVVIAKAVLSVVALGVAVALSIGRPVRGVRAVPVLLLVGYLACTVVGAWAADGLLASGIIALRVFLLITTIAILLRHHDGFDVLAALFAALATCGLIGAVTGIANLAEGRLSGGVPPLHANELAAMSAITAVWFSWRVVNGRDRLFDLIGLAVALTVLLATGSRTPLAALALAVIVLLFHLTAVRVRTVGLLLVLGPLLVWAVFGTGVLSGLLLRDGGAASLTTLSNRTIAWQAALAPKASAWLDWFGGGLSLKKIEVPGQFWNTQILDSSWVSVLVQAGIIGFALCVLLVLYGAGITVESSRELRGLQLAVIVFLVARSLLESGLFDASTSFLLLFTTIMATPVGAAVSTTRGEIWVDRVIVAKA